MRVVSDGVSYELGATETTPTIGIVDYSRRTTDDFGVTTVVERGFARRMSVRMALPFDGVDGLQQRLASLRASTATWIADETIEWLSVDGFYKDFEIDLAVPPTSFCTLTVEGLADTEAVTDAGADPAPEGLDSTLRVIQADPVTDAVLLSSNVPETDYPEWAAETTYAAGVRVRKSSQHRVFESAAAGNIGHDPAAATGEWIDLRPTNRWAMFDQALGTQTSAASPIVTAFQSNGVTAVALLDVTAASVRVQATGYDQTQAVGAGAVVFTGLSGATGTLTVTISGSGTLAVGTLMIGRVVSLGLTEASPTAGITDYSRKEVDEFGAVAVVQRAWAKRMVARSLIRTDAVDQVANRLAEVRARPSLWIGSAGADSLTVYGFFKKFSIEVGDTVSKLSLSIEGLSKAAPPPESLSDLVIQALPAPVQPANLLPGGKIDAANIGFSGGPLIVTLDDLQPAEAGATLGGTIGTNVKLPDSTVAKPGQLLNSAMILTPDGQLAMMVDGVSQPLGKVKLPDLGVATDASRRQLEADLASLSAAVATLSAGQAIVQGVFRDAGLYTDPGSGIAKLFAIERRAEQIASLSVSLDAALASINLKATVNYVDQAVLAAQLGGQTVDLSSIFVRLTSAETNISGLQASIQLKADATIVTGLSGMVSAVQTSLDALTATVATKASQTIVDAQGARLTLAEQTISALDGASIAQTVTASRRAPADSDAAGAATIIGLLNDLQGNQVAQTGIAQARTELGARVGDAFTAIAFLSTSLSAQIGANTALFTSEVSARAAADSALSTRIDTLSATAGDNAAAITTEITTRANADGALSTRIDTLQSSTTSSFANVGVILTAQATTNTSVASSIGTLTTTVGDHTAALTSYGQSIDGLKLKWGVEFNNSGRITGFVLNGSATRTDAIFVVDHFKVCRPDGSGERTLLDIDSVGKVTMHDVEVDTLMVNTAIVPAFVSSTSAIAGTGVS